MTVHKLGDHRWYIARYNAYHKNYRVSDLKGGCGIGPSPEKAVSNCRAPSTYRTRREALKVIEDIS